MKKKRFSLGKWSRSRPSIDESPASTTTTLVPAPPPSPPARLPRLAPGDQPTHIPGHKVSALEVRELHELIRLRYTLDVLIWSNRKCVPRNRPLVEVNMRRADAALRKINSTVEMWDTREAWTSYADWQRLKDIRYKLGMNGKREWMKHPPWEEEDSYSDIDFQRLNITG